MTLHDKAVQLNREILRIKAKAQRLDNYKVQLEKIAFRNSQLLITTELELKETLTKIDN